MFTFCHSQEQQQLVLHGLKSGNTNCSSVTDLLTRTLSQIHLHGEWESSEGSTWPVLSVDVMTSSHWNTNLWIIRNNTGPWKASGLTLMQWERWAGLGWCDCTEPVGCEQREKRAAKNQFVAGWDQTRHAGISHHPAAAQYACFGNNLNEYHSNCVLIGKLCWL